MPVVGSEYEVVGNAEANYHPFEMYQLKGFPDDCGYVKSAFAILPDATADEMQEEEREAIVNLETVLA